MTLREIIAHVRAVLPLGPELDDAPLGVAGQRLGHLLGVGAARHVGVGQDHHPSAAQGLAVGGPPLPRPAG